MNISGGLFKKDGKLFSTSHMHSHDKKGFAAYTINSNGELSIFIHNRMQDGFAHSSMNAGAPVVAAGEIKIENGVLKAITTHSGHYQPSLFNVARALEHFASNNIDISQAKVVTFAPPFNLGLKYTPVFYQAYDQYMYETNASQLYKEMDKVINDNIDIINDQVKSYQKGGLRTYIYRAKDKLIGSTLTQERANLAAQLENALIEFKQGCEHISPEALPLKITELEKIITIFQDRNKNLSSNANKKESSGRLENRMKDFKNQLIEIKDQAKGEAEKNCREI